MDLVEYIPNQIWTQLYPVHYAGLDFKTLMTVIRLSDGSLMLHSPCEIAPETKQSIESAGGYGRGLNADSIETDSQPKACTGACRDCLRRDDLTSIALCVERALQALHET